MLALGGKIMFTKKVVVTVLIATGTLGAAATPLPSVAASNVDIQLNFGPPPARYEAVPAPRHGYVWEPGHWQWNGHRHVWVAGHWIRERPGYAYYAPRWVERNGRWHYQTSRWDRDGDGIPNRNDPTPNGSRSWDRDGDGIPNRNDPTPDGVRPRDRDRDGVPNRYDAAPDNPYRR
jgi:WXXGXW repeat (2 copies)